jgi:hypothetical protein
MVDASGLASEPASVHDREDRSKTCRQSPRTASVYAREDQGTVYVINVRFTGVKPNQKRNAT